MTDTKNTIAMAVIRDKFQSSAKELIKNLEDAVNGRKRVTDNSSNGGANSFENAFRVMFSSCTLGAEGATTSDPPARDFTDRPFSPSFSGSQCNSPRGGQMKTLPAQGFIQSRDLGEHIYAQLFYDDQQRAEQAVHSLRDQPKLTEMTAPRSSCLPRPFPVSSPHTPSPPGRPLQAEELNIPNTQTFDDGISAISAHTLEAMAQCLPPKTRSELSRESSLFPSSQDASTDEREAVATLGATKSPFGSHHPPPPTSSHRNCLPRIRSHNTSLGSISSGLSKASPGRMSPKSKNSYSTQTTESSSFEHWHRQEMKYWEDVAQRQEDDEFYRDEFDSPDRSKKSKSSASERRRMRATKVRDLVSKSFPHQQQQHDNYTSTTTTTMSASTSWTANFDRHPHETFPFDTNDVFVYGNPAAEMGASPLRRHLSSDRHRIESVLLLPGATEMGEI